MIPDKMFLIKNVALQNEERDIPFSEIWDNSEKVVRCKPSYVRYILVYTDNTAASVRTHIPVQRKQSASIF